MIRTKLKAFLSAHDISVYELVQAVVDETEALSEASVYKIASGQRNPSLASLDIILSALARLTQSPVAVSDVLEYIPEDETALVEDSEDELHMVWQLALKQVPLEPVVRPWQPRPVRTWRSGNRISRRLVIASLTGGCWSSRWASFGTCGSLEPRCRPRSPSASVRNRQDFWRLRPQT